MQRVRTGRVRDVPEMREPSTVQERHNLASRAGQVYGLFQAVKPRYERRVEHLEGGDERDPFNLSYVLEPKGTLQPEKSMRAVSPLKSRDQQHRRLSSNAASPVHPAAHGAQRAGCVDEARLLRAIQALDGDEPQGKSKTSSGNPVCTARTARRVCEALGFLLELLLLLEHQSVQECSDARAELETIWEARILGCLKRFITKRKHVDAKFVGCSCGDQCVQRLVCYTLVSILFRLSRYPRLASGVVKNGLHELLLFDLYSESPEPISIQNTTIANNQDKLDFIDPRDLLLSIDPFDWCYQSTCSRIAEKETQNAVFFVPMGVRSLMYLLAGDVLPTDEITEYGTKLRHCLENTSGGFCLNAPSQATPSKKKNQLPSIFAFPTKEEECPTPSGFSGRGASALCSRRSDAAFQMGRSQTALQHMTIRSAVALLQNLGRSPSPERKLLLRDGKCVKMLVLAVAVYGNAGPQQTSRDSTKSTDLNGLLSCQKMAFDPCLLAQMAQSGLSLLHQDEIKSFLKKQPELKELAKQQLFQDVDIAALNPSTSSHAKTKKKPTKSKAPSTLSIAEQLQAASEESRRESAAAEVLALERDVEVERSLQRQQLRGQCDKLEQLRHQLSQSLSLLHSGRSHADPNQSFVSWIASLPTIEKKAQEQQLNVQMRQQHAVEMAFQREEARKRRLKECAMMQQNDHDALNDTENSRKEQKRLEFLRMHEEMKLLQQQQKEDAQDDSILGIIHEVHQLAGDDGDGDHTELNDIQAKMLHQRTLAAQRKARQLKLDEEQKRLLWVHQHKQEAKELERMGKEDLYYVERLSRLKQLELEKQKLLLLAQKQQSANPIEEQQRKIECMRQLDLERKLAEKETERMRTEDLFARQLRYLDAERRSLEAQHEHLARKYMDAEERDCRIRCKLIAREQTKLEELEAKRLRVEAKKLQKRQREYEKQVFAAWIESWDANGNVYYYNSVTGISQWESPFSTQ